VKGPIKVGYQCVLSGTLAGYGEFHKMGVQMAVDEINEKGGIAGAKVEVDIRDSTTKPEDAIKNARYFVDSWGADFLAGIDSSGQVLALAPIMEQLDRVLIVTHAATEKLTEEWVFKKGVKQISATAPPPTRTPTPRPSWPRTSPSSAGPPSAPSTSTASPAGRCSSRR